MRTPEDEMYAGGWRCLCAAVLLQAVQRLAHCPKIHKAGSGYKSVSSKSGLYKEAVYQKMCAREWMKGGKGTVTLEDCCDALGVDPDRMRSMVDKACPDLARFPVLSSTH